MSIVRTYAGKTYDIGKLYTDGSGLLFKLIGISPRDELPFLCVIDSGTQVTLKSITAIREGTFGKITKAPIEGIRGKLYRFSQPADWSETHDSFVYAEFSGIEARTGTKIYVDASNRRWIRMEHLNPDLLIKEK